MDSELTTIRTSEKSDEVCAAFVAAQADMPMAVGTDGVNPHFRSKYATLAAMTKAVRPVLAKHDLAHLFSAPNGNMALRLIHTSGQWLEIAVPFVVAQQNNPQAVGSGITYARRYLLGMISGVPSDEEDDGNAASAPPKENAPPSAPPEYDGGELWPTGKYKGTPIEKMETAALDWYAEKGQLEDPRAMAIAELARRATEADNDE